MIDNPNDFTNRAAAVAADLAHTQARMNMTHAEARADARAMRGTKGAADVTIPPQAPPVADASVAPEPYAPHVRTMPRVYETF